MTQKNNARGTRKTNNREEARLPVMTRAELNEQGIGQLDFVYIVGDAYIDHPSFGCAIITRVLMAKGYTVGVIAQPDWHDAEAFRALGMPKLAFLVSGGNIDSMVDHYTVALRKRDKDLYTPDGVMGKRPDRAVIVYANRCREAYPRVPVIIGGIEASLRRFAHYDYWDDRVRHSILYDSTADILLYGMGERSIVAVADALKAGTPVRDIRSVAGSCYRVSDEKDLPKDCVMLPSYTEVATDKTAYAKAFMSESAEQDAVRGKILVQPHEKGYLVVNPPSLPLNTAELDAVYALPFTRRPHPVYTGHIPAIDEVSFSLTSCRGCFGACSFCALTFHQGRVVTARSHDSIVAEAEKLTKDPAFKGYIHDVGGPTANFRFPACEKQLKSGTCKNRQCIGFDRCPNMRVDHTDYVRLLRRLRELPGVKKVFVRSGVRFDYAVYDKDDTFLRELVRHHVSGQLKIAPEHVSDRVLYYMNKPRHEVYERFMQKYNGLNRSMEKDQYTVPYFISSHPGAELSDAIELACFLKRHNMHPEQVQDFYPTPGTLSTCMYYTGLDPRTMRPVYVPRTNAEKQMQRALMQYYLPRNFALVRKALREAGREDLIGYEKECLVRPETDGNAYARPKGNGTKPAPAAKGARKPSKDRKNGPHDAKAVAKATTDKRKAETRVKGGKHR